MAVMARLLACGSFSQAVTEKAGCQKLVAKYIQKELLEADEANLLDEEDMHVFDLNPLSDPLHLVCCNSCKKPVKASQFVAHAELCGSLGFAEEQELDSGKGNRKPPRKERKKSVAAGNQMVSSGAKGRFTSVDTSATAVSSSHLVQHVGITLSGLDKETSGKFFGSIGEMVPLTKRPKLVASDVVQPSDDIRTLQGVNNITGFQDRTYVPAPLATKTYYAQRNNRLQSAIGHMYNQASTKECLVDNKESLGITWEASPHRVISDHQLNTYSDEKFLSSSLGTQSADKIIKESPGVGLVKEGCQPSDNSLNQVPLTNTYMSQATSFGEIPTRYHSMPYSFTGKSVARSS